MWCGTTTSTAPTTKIHRGAGESSVLRDPRHHPPNTIDSGQYTLNAWEPRDNVVGFIARIDVGATRRRVGEEMIRMEGKGWWRCRCCSRAHVRSPDATKQRPSSACRQSPPYVGAAETHALSLLGLGGGTAGCSGTPASVRPIRHRHPALPLLQTPPSNLASSPRCSSLLQVQLMTLL